MPAPPLGSEPATVSAMGIMQAFSIMGAMTHITAFLSLLFFASTAFAQVPPGFPYDAAKHPNPVFTYVTNQDFKPVTFAEAQKLTGLELLGLSQQEGRQDSVEVAVLPATNRK